MLTGIVEPKKWLVESLNCMEYLLNLKLKQCKEFKKTLLDSKKKNLIYKQPNYCKRDIYFWSVNHSDKLASVLPIYSLVGNNHMGQLLMLIREKL